jgi:hypothetical protein
MRVAVLVAAAILTACCSSRSEAQSSIEPSAMPAASASANSESRPLGSSPITWSAPLAIEGQPSPPGLRGMSCPTINLCVAVIDSGEAVTSTAPISHKAAWTLTPIDKPENGLSGISCASNSLCVAIDLSGDVVTSGNPTGGSAAWTVTQVAGLSLIGISCPAVSFCAAVDVDGHAFVSTNPLGGRITWSTIDLTRGIPYGFPTQDIFCPSAGFCAVAGSDSVWTSTSPKAGAAAWRESPIPGVPGNSLIDWVYCQSARLCFALDDAADLFISTNPAANSPSWQLSGASASGVNSISCPTADFCVAVTDGGVIMSRGLVDMAKVWTAPENPGGGSAWQTIWCPSAYICIAGQRKRRDCHRKIKLVPRGFEATGSRFDQIAMSQGACYALTIDPCR